MSTKKRHSLEKWGERREKRRHGDEFIGTKRCRKIVFSSFSWLFRAFDSLFFFLFTTIVHESRQWTEKDRRKKIAVKLWNPPNTCAVVCRKFWFELAFFLLCFATWLWSWCALASDRDDDDDDYLIQNMRPLPSAVFTILLLFRTAAAAAAAAAELSNGFYFISPLLVMFLCFPSCLFRFVRSFIRCCLYASIRSLAISRRQSNEQLNERLTRTMLANGTDRDGRKEILTREKNGLHWITWNSNTQRDLFCLQSSNTFGALLILFPSIRSSIGMPLSVRVRVCVQLSMLLSMCCAVQAHLSYRIVRIEMKWEIRIKNVLFVAQQIRNILFQRSSLLRRFGRLRVHRNSIHTIYRRRQTMANVPIHAKILWSLCHVACHSGWYCSIPYKSQELWIQFGWWWIIIYVSNA